jgi:hypothetical protein
MYGTVPFLINGGSLSKASVPPFFLKDENIFQKSASVVPILAKLRLEPRRPIFEKKNYLREKGGVLIFLPGLYGGLYGQNLSYKFKNSYGDFQNRNFEKSHRTTGPRSDL